MCPRLSDGGSDSLSFMASQIVHDDDISGSKCRNEGLFDIGPEADTVYRPVEQNRCVDPVMAQSCQEGEGPPPAKGRLGQEPLAFAAAAMAACHVGFGPGLIDKDQAAWIEPALIAPPARTPTRHVRPVLFGGVQRFF